MSVDFYNKPLEYAKANNEMDAWRESLHENRRCAKAIETLIGDNHRNNHLDTDKIISEAVKEFGVDRVSHSLASTIQSKSWDGRFSQSNKEWAASVNIPDNGRDREININAHPALLNGVVSDYRKFLVTLEKNLAERQDMDIAAPTATRAESEVKMAHETKFEVSSMSKLEGNGAKALANVILNGEFALSGIKVREGQDGNLVVSPPSEKKFDGTYEDVYFPITKEAQAALKKAVLDVYNDMTEKGQDKYRADIPLSDKSFSTITAKMSSVDKGNLKAAGEVTIDNCFVVKGVKMMNGTNSQGENKDFVSMPSHQTSTGEYFPYIKPITAAAHEKLNKAVQGGINNIDRYQYKGCKFAELGDKDNIKQSGRLNNKFAEALMSKLDAAGIQYHAKISETTTISVKGEDKLALDSIRKELVKELNPQKQGNNQEQTQKHGKSK